MPATMSSASVRLRRIRHLVGYETSGRYSAERGVATRESADDAPRILIAVSRRRASPKPFDRSVGLLFRLRDDDVGRRGRRGRRQTASTATTSSPSRKSRRRPPPRRPRPAYTVEAAPGESSKAATLRDR